jgi:hypothetical protein
VQALSSRKRSEEEERQYRWRLPQLISYRRLLVNSEMMECARMKARGPIEAEEARSRWSRLAISPTVSTTHQFTELAAGRADGAQDTAGAGVYRRIFEMVGLRAPPRESDTPAARATRAAILRSTDTARHLRERQRHLSKGAMLLAEIRAFDITDLCPKQETTTSSSDDADVPELEGSTDDDDVPDLEALYEETTTRLYKPTGNPLHGRKFPVGTLVQEYDGGDDPHLSPPHDYDNYVWSIRGHDGYPTAMWFSFLAQKITAQPETLLWTCGFLCCVALVT